MKRIVALLAALTAFQFMQAQPDDDDRAERIESLRIAFITEKLALTSKEAQNFWPVFNEFSSQMKSLKEKQRELGKQIRNKTDISDAEADKLIQDQLQLRQQELDLAKKYTAEFRKVLQVKKVARLVSLEDEFRQQMMQRLREGRPGPPPGRRRD
jgi:hypothetical protein